MSHINKIEFIDYNFRNTFLKTAIKQCFGKKKKKAFLFEYMESNRTLH